MEALFSDPIVQTLGGALGFALLFVIRHFQKEKAAKTEARFEQGVEIAYSVVKELSRLTKTSADDKVALGLKSLRDYLATHGQTVSPAEEARAKLLFKALHGEEKSK